MPALSGCRILGEDDFAATFGLGGGAIMRLTDLPGHEALSHTVLGDRLRTSARSQRTSGARALPSGSMKDSARMRTASGARRAAAHLVAWFTDPDGNVLSLTQFG